MRNIVLLAHISLDGYVANEKGQLDGFDSGDENLAFVNRLTESADAALFGRVSYQLLDAHWPKAKDRPGASVHEINYSHWYNGCQKLVVSTQLAGTVRANTTIIHQHIKDELIAVKNQPGKDILIFGSPQLSQWMMTKDLIDSFWIFINPVIFGKGIPLFTEELPFKKLKLNNEERFPNGELALNFTPR